MTERLTERHGKYINVQPKEEIMCSNYCTSCGKADCDHIRNALEKLARYEDLEEQGRLIELPCAVGSLVWEIGIFDTGEEAGLFRAKPFTLSDMEHGRLGCTVFLTLDDAIEMWKKIDTFGGFADEIANVEAALKDNSNEEIDR